MKTNLFIYKSLITNYYWDKNSKYLIYFAHNLTYKDGANVNTIL